MGLFQALEPRVPARGSATAERLSSLMHEALKSTVRCHRESEVCAFVTGHSVVGMIDSSLLQSWAE